MCVLVHVLREERMHNLWVLVKDCSKTNLPSLRSCQRQIWNLVNLKHKLHPWVCGTLLASSDSFLLYLLQGAPPPPPSLVSNCYLPPLQHGPIEAWVFPVVQKNTVWLNIQDMNMSMGNRDSWRFVGPGYSGNSQTSTSMWQFSEVSTDIVILALLPQSVY